MGTFSISDHTQQQKAATDKHEVRNYRLALINGILVRIGFRFIDSNMVLAAFVKELTKSNMMVGLTSSTMRAGWMWPQLFISNLLEHRPRKMPFYILGASMRVVSWILILLLTISIGSKNYLLLFLCFYFLYFAGSSGMGVSTLPFNDIVAKSIPVRKRARLFGHRQLIGGTFSIGAGFIIRYILSERFFLSLPYNYAFMFGLAAFTIACSSTCFALTREPIQPVRDARRPLWQHLKRGPHFLRVDRDYRYFTLLKAIATFGSMCIPFYVPYALDQIGVPTSTIGSYIAVGAISAVISNILWTYVGEKRGSKLLLIMSSCLACAAPIIAALIRYLPVSYQASSYSLVFIVTQCFMNGRGIGYMTYSLNMAPSMSRPTYLGFLNTMMFPMSFVPVLAGALLQIMSYEMVFILSAVMSVLAVYFAINLSNVDERDDIELKDSL